MHPQVQAYIDRINTNDPELTEINLSGLNLNDADIAPLMVALANNLNVAQRIAILRLDNNELTSQLDLTMLTALLELHLNNNQLKYSPILNGLVDLEYLGLSHNQLEYPPILT